MSIANYKEALTRARNFALKGGSLVESIQGKDKTSVVSLMSPKAPSVADTQVLQESVELSEEIKGLNKIYEMLKTEQNIPQDKVKTYTIEPGDDISDIQEKAGMSNDEFLVLNPDIAEDDIVAGNTVEVVQRKEA